VERPPLIALDHADFEPGRYEAEILITDTSSKQESRARGSFEVNP